MDGVRHHEHKAFSLAEMLDQECAELMPKPTAFDGYVERSAKVSSTCLVAATEHRQWVACVQAGQRLSTRLYRGRVEIASCDEMIVARHKRPSNRGHICCSWQHHITSIQRKPGPPISGVPFAGMPAPMQRRPQGLTRVQGGDKAMAQVLNCAFGHGLEAVLVAVK